MTPLDHLIRPEIGRELDVHMVAGEATGILTRCRPDASPTRKWAARVVVCSHLEDAAERIDEANGPMSPGRAELVLARAEATLTGRHEVADALAREMVGVL